jgi:hypothetical protein
MIQILMNQTLSMSSFKGLNLWLTLKSNHRKTVCQACRLHMIFTSVDQKRGRKLLSKNLFQVKLAHNNYPRIESILGRLNRKGDRPENAPALRRNAFNGSP